MKNNKMLESIKNVANKEIKNTNEMLIKLTSENLIECPFNDEDVSCVEDLVESFSKQQMIEPLIVTKYNLEDEDKYMIVSGNRRFRAGEKMGYVNKYGSYNCIVRNYNSIEDLKEAVLDANMDRNEDTDPLLYIRRVKKYSDLYDKRNEMSKMKINKRDYLALKLNMSLGSVDRYIMCSKLINPALDLIEKKICPNSGMMFLGKFTEKDQEIIVKLLEEVIKYLEKELKDNFKSLSRNIIGMVCKRYEDNKQVKFEDIVRNINVVKPKNEDENKYPKGEFIKEEDEKDESEDKVKNSLRSNEINYDVSHREAYPNEEKKYEDEPTAEDMEVAKTPFSKKEKEAVKKIGSFANSLEKLQEVLSSEALEEVEITEDTSNIMLDIAVTLIEKNTQIDEDIKEKIRELLK